jgi:hypothetical protein
MSYSLQKLPGESIVIFTAGKDFDMAQEVASAATDANKLLDGLPDEQIVYINDMSQMPSLNLDGAIVGASETGRGQSPIFHHPKMRMLLIITKDPLLKMAVHGLDSSIYGNIHAEIVDTLDQALKVARK